MSAITWLHLSDLHACHPRHGWDAGTVTRTLIDDLRQLQSAAGLRPDLLFFTGDAAFGELGTKLEETVAGQLECFAKFLTAVRTAFEPEIPRRNVFLVPGNHDVNRRRLTELETDWLDSRTEKGEPKKVEKLIQDGDGMWQRYMERLADYRAFLEDHGFKHLLDDPDRLIYTALRQVGGVRVGIAGFNTAWSCCRDGERGRLWMAGRWQQGTLRPGLDGSDLRIALLHHPPDWLVEFETPDFGRGLERDFHFLLHGHEHRDWVLNKADGYTVLAAGACYERSDSEHNGYNLVRLELDSGRGEVWLRRYEDSGGGWVARPVATKTDERGVWPLVLGPLTTQAAPAATAPAATAPAAAVVATLPPALEPASDVERYLQRLRAAHRDLPLAGFETRVRLPIRIDDVYIPLQAHVQAAIDRESRQLGAQWELDGQPPAVDREVAFDASLALAREHGLQGVVVLGDPGSGKTTLLKHFVLAATDPLIGPASLGLADATVPVLIELRRVRDAAAGLKPALEAAVARTDLALDAAAFSVELLRRDHLLVLVDGLDEVADRAARRAVSRWLEEAIHQLPKSTFVVTSRYAGYKGDARLDGRFLELHARPVEEAAATRFIGAWYLAVESQAELGRDAAVAAGLASEQAGDLVAKIFTPEARTESLRRLAKNPLMLQILCLVHRDRQQLPERRVELYRECVQVLLELWRRAKGTPVELDGQQALRLLQPLAYRLHAAQLRQAELGELLPHLEAPLRELRRDPGDGARLLAAIRDQSGVLVSLGQSAYGFLHLSFQEYLTALHVQDRHASEPAILRELAAHFGDPWWREVILLCLGLNNPSLFEPLLEAVVAAGRLHHDVALADDCLRDALVSTPAPLVRALAAGVDDATERYHVLRLLRALPGWQADGGDGRALVERLARVDPSPQVRSMAVELLGSGAVMRSGVAVADPKERQNAKDGSVLVHVPGGEYTLGTDEDLEAYRAEHKDWPKPEHRARLSPFWIGKYPVTNAQYRAFLEAKPGRREPDFWTDARFNDPEQPVVGVSWLEALAYCRWAGLQLPSEAQWEAAARGEDGRRYPWGDEAPTPELANYAEHEGATTPVGAYPKGAGPFGTLDQAGNVWEWCLDAFDPESYRGREGQLDPLLAAEDEGDETAVRVVRSGSWAYPAGSLPAAIRLRYQAGSRSPFLGFRVVVSGSGPEP